MIFCGLVASLLMTGATAQTAGDPLAANAAFTGAKAEKKKYQAIYQLDNSDPKVIEKAIRNINNALADPRLVGKLTVELVTFSGGTEACLKGNKFEEDLKSLVEKGVIIAQCANSLRERKIERSQLYDFIAVIPSGNGELILRQQQGWAIVKP